MEETKALIDETELPLGDAFSSTSEKIHNRFEALKSMPANTTESKKNIWLEFLSIWSDILQFPPTDIPSSYEECANLMSSIYRSTNFLTIKRDVNIGWKSFYIVITALNQAHFKEYLRLPRDKETSPENKTYFVHTQQLLFIVSQVVLFLSFITKEEQDFVEQNIDLFTVLIDRIDQSMPEHCEQMVAKDYSLGVLNGLLLSILWNLTDKTVLVPTLIKYNLPKKTVAWLSQAPILDDKARRPLISIAHNISRHDDGADELNQYGAIEMIKAYQKIKVEKADSRGFIASMALALLSTPEQIKQDKKGMNSVLNRLLQLTMDAARGDRFRRDGFHVSEPLAVLVKLFVVEERTMDYILCHAETEPASDMLSTINLFVSLLEKFANAFEGADRLEQFTVIALLNIFWSISFQSAYVKELVQHDRLISIVRSFLENDSKLEILEQYKPRSMEGVPQAARGILHNLNLDNKSEVTSQDQNSSNASNPIEGKDGKPWIMISYCHGDNVFCNYVLDVFARNSDKLQVWIDRTHCQGASDLWESIAEGMERASTIVCLLSGQYFESKSCRQEFIYAIDSLKKPVVPVLIGNFDPKGWLGIRMSGLKYVRFRDAAEPDLNKLNELLTTVLSSLPSTREPSSRLPLLATFPMTPVSISSVVPTPRIAMTLRPFDQWSPSGEDIQAWFVHHRISPQLRDLFDFQTGEEMLDYAALMIKDREKQIQIYGKVYAQKYHGQEMPPHEFLRFAQALEQLYKENQKSPSLSTKSSSTTENKSSVCLIL